MDDLRYGPLAAALLILLATSLAWQSLNSLSQRADDDWRNYRVAVRDMGALVRSVATAHDVTPAPPSASGPVVDVGPPLSSLPYCADERPRTSLWDSAFVRGLFVLLGLLAASINVWMAVNATEWLRLELRAWALRHPRREPSALRLSDPTQK